MDDRKKRESSRFDQEPITESDLASDKMGDNELQGNDQLNVHNERRSVPDEKIDADDVIESFEKTDKNVRAERDLGGRKSSGDK